jgi:multidrug efflux system outer membrane protein
MSFANVLVLFDKYLLTFAKSVLRCAFNWTKLVRGQRMPKRMLVIATALVTTSCAGMPSFQAENVLPVSPGSWSAAVDTMGTQEEVQDWIEALGDPHLAALIDEAFRANPSLTASLARYNSALAGARLAGANLLPTLNAGLDYTRRETNTAGSNSYSLSLSSSWEADLWGRVRDGANAGTLDAEAAAEDLRAARLSIAGLVAKGWFGLVEAHLQSELAIRDLAAKQNALDLTERRFARGLVRSSDVRTARSALASSEASVASRSRTEASAARSLETLLGRYPAGRLASDADFPMLDELAGIGAPGDILARRPDVRAAEHRLVSAGLRADAARKALFPSLSLTGGSGTGGADFDDLLDVDNLISTLTSSITAPIFRGGQLRAQRDQAQANAELQVANYVSTALSAWQEAENSIHADTILAARVDSLGRAFEEAAAAEELVVRQYSRGVATIFDLLNAYSRRISAESLYISSRRDRAANRVDLYLAIAGDFSAAETADQAAQTGE